MGMGWRADADSPRNRRIRYTPEEGHHTMLLKLIRRLRRDKKGQGLVEYGLLIAGVALICAAAVSVFGHKTSDLIAAVAAIMPGAHTGDNGPIVSGHLIETTAASAAAPI